MSIDGRLKLNMPGIGGGLNTRKSSNVSSQATRNLGRSSNATSGTHFSLNSKRSPGFVEGQFVSKGSNKLNYSTQRAALNSRSGNVSSTRTYTPAYSNMSMNGSIMYPQQQTNSTSNFFNSLNMGMQIGMQTVNFLDNIGVLNLNSSNDVSSNNTVKSNSSTLNQALNSLTGSPSSGGSGVSGIISNMSGCSDSASLRQAISNAETQLSSLSYVKTDQAKSDYNTAKDKVTNLEKDIKTKEKDVDAKEEAVSRADQTVQTATTKRDVAKQGLQNAMTKNTKCTQAYAEAKANLTQAQTTAENTPKTITVTNPDGTTTQKPNEPAYTNAQNALKQAEKAEQEAKKQLEMSEQEVKDMEEQCKTAEETLKSEEKKLDEAKTKQTEAKETLEAAQKELDEAKADLDKQKEAVEKFETDEKNYNKLEKEIEKQKERLTKLEKEEQKEYNKLGDKINNKANQVNNRAIDPSDGMSLSEKIKQRKNERDERKIDKLADEKSQLADNVAKTNILADNSNVIQGKNGEELRTGQLPSGKTVYFIGNREVNQTEFEAAKA